MTDGALPKPPATPFDALGEEIRSSTTWTERPFTPYLDLASVWKRRPQRKTATRHPTDDRHANGATASTGRGLHPPAGNTPARDARGYVGHLGKRASCFGKQSLATGGPVRQLESAAAIVTRSQDRPLCAASHASDHCLPACPQPNVCGSGAAIACLYKPAVCAMPNLQGSFSTFAFSQHCPFLLS